MSGWLNIYICSNIKCFFFLITSPSLTPPICSVSLSWLQWCTHWCTHDCTTALLYKSLFTVGFKLCFGDLNTSGQTAHDAIHTCVYHASPRCSAAPCVQISLLPTSLPLEGRRALRTVIASVCHQTITRFVSHGPAKKTKMFQEVIYMYGLFQLWRFGRTKSFATCKSAPDKMQWWCIFLLRHCRGRISVYTTKTYIVKCVPDHLGKWFERSHHKASWWSFTLVNNAVHLWSDCPRRMLIPSVNRV